jgi:parvulin-like peptidyl-prolyl isomerase
MFLISILYLLVMSPDVTIVKQNDTSVPLGDLDSYVYMLPPEKRSGFINDKRQIEKNIITLTNINIVYDHILNTDLKNDINFKVVEELVENKTLELDDEFYLKLGLDKQVAHDNVKQYLIKKEYYARLIKHIETELNKGKIDQLVNEYFLINFDKWVVPEKRDLSIIQIDAEDQSPLNIKNILTELIKDPSTENFEKFALEYSDDPTVKSNKGHLSTFRQRDLNYPFKDKIFEAKIGIIPRVFKYEGRYYLVRVNNIIEKINPKLEDHKESIKNQIIKGAVETKFQNIINAQAMHKMNVSPEVMAHVFERYKVLIED